MRALLKALGISDLQELETHWKTLFLKLERDNPSFGKVRGWTSARARTTSNGVSLDVMAVDVLLERGIITVGTNGDVLSMRPLYLPGSKVTADRPTPSVPRD